MQVILDAEETWSLMTALVSQVIDKAGVSADGKAKLRRWRQDRASGTPAMAELSIGMNEAVGSTLDEQTYRLIRRKGGYVPSSEL
jgi:hypothetical protein